MSDISIGNSVSVWYLGKIINFLKLRVNKRSKRKREGIDLKTKYEILQDRAGDWLQSNCE